MSFNINEETQYTKPVDLSNIYGRDVRYNKMNKSIDTEQSFYPSFGRDRKITTTLPIASAPKLYNNVVENRLIATTTNNCKHLHDPYSIYHLQHESNFIKVNHIQNLNNINHDPRYNPNENYRFTKNYLAKR